MVPELVIVPEFLMMPLLMMVPELVIVPVLINTIADLIVIVSPELIDKDDTVHVIEPLHVPPIA